VGFSHTQRPLAVVTGASGGIGAAVAGQLARRGVRTVLVARRTERLRELARELAPLAPSVVMSLDLADQDAIEPAMRDLLREHGPVDILIHAAGYGILREFLEQRPEDIHRLMQVHYFAAVQMIHAVLPGMVERRHGHIINIGSIAAKVGPWGHCGYSAAKAALQSLTHTLAAEYGDRGVHFSYVQPGIVNSAFFEGPGYRHLASNLRRHALSCDYVARRIVGLLDRPRLELVVPRHHRVVDWLKLLLPMVVHGTIARRSRPDTSTQQPAPPDWRPSESQVISPALTGSGSSQPKDRIA